MMTVWAVVRRPLADGGIEEVWYVGIDLHDVWEVFTNLDEDTLVGYWWTLREHTLGEKP